MTNLNHPTIGSGPVSEADIDRQLRDLRQRRRERKTHPIIIDTSRDDVFCDPMPACDELSKNWQFWDGDRWRGPLKPGPVAACTSDRCRQGRAPCPTPQACQVHEVDYIGTESEFKSTVRGLLICAGIMLVAYIVMEVISPWLN